MSSPTPPFTDPARTALRRPGAELARELARREGGQQIELSRSSPPEEVLQQMAHADAINERLRRQGYEIGFALSADATSLQIELRDSTGRLLRVLSAEEAVELAVGRPLE